MEAGVRLPLSTTAAGRAYLAATPKIERDHLLREVAKKVGDEWPALEKSLEDSFREYEAFGFCLCQALLNRGHGQSSSSHVIAQVPYAAIESKGIENDEVVLWVNSAGIGKFGYIQPAALKIKQLQHLQYLG